MLDAAVDTQVRDCLDLYHKAAHGLAGVFVLTVIDPKTGKVRPQQFRIGDVDGMAAEAVARSETANVYFAPAILRRDLPRGSRGKTEDIVAVLGLSIDDDCDTGNGCVLPPIGPAIEITTCKSPVANRQPHFVFSRPLPPGEAEALAKLLHAKCGGDHGTKDIAHVWRLPGTLNHPTATKLARGRPAEPQRVELTGGSLRPVDPDALRRALDAMPDLKPQTRRANGSSNGVHHNGSLDRDATLAQLPGWLIDLIETEAAAGKRSEHCFHVMQALLEHGLTDAEVHLVAYGAPFADKYSGRGDLEAEIARARSKWEQAGSKREHGANGAHRERSTSSARDDSDVAAWPSLGAAAMHGLAGQIAELAVRDSEADPVAVLATTLVWAGAVFGRNRFLAVGEDVHHPRLFAALVGASSRARKGTSLGPARRIFEAAERKLQSGSTLSFPSGRSLKLSHGPLSSGEGLVDAIRDKRDEQDSGGVVDKRLLCVEGEFGAVLRTCQRQGNTLSTTLRVAWDGWKLAPLTKNNKVCASDPHICVVAHVTRHELMELLTASDIWNGFANRFVWLAVRRGKVVPSPKAMPDADVDGLGSELARIIEDAHSRTGDAARITMSTLARGYWEGAYGELTEDHTGILGAVTSRAESQTLRLAMTYALLDGADHIDLQHIEAAHAFWRYAFESARYLFGKAELDPVAQRVLEALADGPKTQNEIFDLFGRHLPKERLASVLGILQERGRITLREEATGGRPRKVWSLAI